MDFVMDIFCIKKTHFSLGILLNQNCCEVVVFRGKKKYFWDMLQIISYVCYYFS